MKSEEQEEDRDNTLSPIQRWTRSISSRLQRSSPSSPQPDGAEQLHQEDNSYHLQNSTSPASTEEPITCSIPKPAEKDSDGDIAAGESRLSLGVSDEQSISLGAHPFDQETDTSSSDSRHGSSNHAKIVLNNHDEDTSNDEEKTKLQQSLPIEKNTTVRFHHAGAEEEGLLLRKRGSTRLISSIVERDNANNAANRTFLSKTSLKYDLDGDGVLDENEKALRDMDNGDGIDLHQVYEKMNDLSRFKEKYANAKFMLFVALAFGVFILCANLAMSIVAVRHYKDTKVKNNIMTTNDKKSQTLSTKGLGSTGSALEDAGDAGGAGGAGGRRWRTQNSSTRSTGEMCHFDDFDRILSSQYFQGALSSQTCEDLYSDAASGVRPITVTFSNGQRGIWNSLSIDNFHRVARFDEELCSIYVFIGDSDTWYFRDCDSNCRFFITPNYQIPLPNCLLVQQSVDRNLSIGSRCDHDKECQSGLCRYKVSPSHVYFWEGPRAASETYNEHLQNLYTDSATQICVGFVPFKNPGALQQSVFNSEGPLQEITPNLYNEFYRTVQLISSIQQTIGDSNGEASYAYHRALAVEPNDPSYRTKFIKETGCIFFYERYRDWQGRCVHASEIENDNNYGVKSPEYKTAKSLDMGVVEKYGNVCYGIFRGTASVDNAQWIMNNDHKRVETINTARGPCYVNNGFARAFWEESGLWANLGGMEHHLRECANECVRTSGNKCTVVVGGHSQGGGLAVIAAIHLQDLDPVVISSAGVSGIYPGHDGKLCPALNKDRIFQFVAAKGEPEKLSYDPASFISEAYTVQMGHEVRPSDESSSSVSYFYPTSPSIYGGLFNSDYNWVGSIHDMENYYHPQLFKKMRDHIRDTGDPIQLGYDNGHVCGFNDECLSKRCARGSSLDPFSRRTCQTPLVDNVNGCFFNADCESDRCDDRFCYAKEENGSVCNEHSDCLSNRCEPTDQRDPNSEKCIGAEQLDSVTTKAPSSTPSSHPSETPSLSSHPSAAPSLSSQPSTEPSLSSQPSCLIYEEEADLDGCGPSNTGGASMTPLSGSYLGGTVIKIENLKYCLLDPTLEIFCRFEGNGFDEVTKGIRLSNSSLECITPFAGLPNSVVNVKYAANQEGCTFSKDWADWGNANDYFMYNEDQGSVKVRGNVTVDDIKVYAVVPNIISLDEVFSVEWNAEALLLEAYASLSRTTTVSEDDLMIDVEILIRDEDAAISSRTEPTFESIQQKTMPSTAMSTTNLTITNDEIMPYLTSNWGVIGELSASFVIRVVAYTYNNEGLRWIGGTRTSQLVGVVHPGTPADTRVTCTLTPASTCQEREDVEALACPPTRDILLNDVAFEEDEICVWPSGNNECDPDYEINFDLQSTCIATSDDLPIHGKYCDGESTSLPTDESSLNGCSCNVFHREATGCYRSGQTQCCYSEEGALLDTPENDGGSFDCYPGDNRNFLDAMKHYLYDVLPYLYCCDKLYGDCKSYYKERPVIDTTNYEIPSAPAYTFGDPHFVSWHVNAFTFSGIGEHVAVCGQVDEGTTVKPVADLLVDCKPDVSRILESRNVFSVNYVFAQQSADHPATITNRVGIEDPTFNGKFIVIQPQITNNTKLDVYVGSALVDFQSITGKIKTYAWGRVKRNDDYNVMTIKVNDGDEVRKVKVTANNGVLSPEVSLVPRMKHGRIIGLLGRSQEDTTLNEYVNSNGVELAGDRTDQTNIYDNFGTTWKITDGYSSVYSLFRQAPTSSRRLQEVGSSYEPVFGIIPMSPELQATADETCAGIENAFINYTCYFDISVTEQPDLIAITTAEAIREEEETVTVLKNQIPVITPDPNQFSSVYLKESKSFSFNIRDSDEDNILSSTVIQNDNNLFKYTPPPEASEGYFGITFNGSTDSGKYKIKIALTDGIASVICTVIVHVVEGLFSWLHEPFLHLGSGEYVAACGELSVTTSESKTNKELLEICSPSVSRNLKGRNAFSAHYVFSEDGTGSSRKITRVGIEDVTLNGQFLVIQPNIYRENELDVFLGSKDILEEREEYTSSWGVVARSPDKSEVKVLLHHKEVPGFDVFDIYVLSSGGILVPIIKFRRQTYDMIGLLGRGQKDSKPLGFVNSNGEEIKTEDPDILFEFFGSTWKIEADHSSTFSLFSQVP